MTTVVGLAWLTVLVAHAVFVMVDVHRESMGRLR